MERKHIWETSTTVVAIAIVLAIVANRHFQFVPIDHLPSAPYWMISVFSALAVVLIANAAGRMLDGYRPLPQSSKELADGDRATLARIKSQLGKDAGFGRQNFVEVVGYYSQGSGPTRAERVTGQRKYTFHRLEQLDPESVSDYCARVRSAYVDAMKLEQSTLEDIEVFVVDRRGRRVHGITHMSTLRT